MSELKLITCILYRGGGDKVLKALYKRGIVTTGHRHARGSAIGDPVGWGGLPKQFEKEILTVLVNKSEAEEIFEFIFNIAEIDRPHGGFLYMENLDKASTYKIPEAPVEF